MLTFCGHALTIQYMLFMAVALCGGCGNTGGLTVAFMPPEVDVHKSDIPVTLLLSGAFCEDNGSNGYQENGRTYQFGPALKEYAEFVIRAEFSDVRVRTPQNAMAPLRRSGLLLEPRNSMLGIERKIFNPVLGSMVVFRISVTWDLRDALTGHLLTQEVFEGRGVDFELAGIGALGSKAVSALAAETVDHLKIPERIRFPRDASMGSRPVGKGPPAPSVPDPREIK
jgi:hypothetical protein